MNKILEEYRKTIPKDTTLGDVINDFDINFIDYPLNIPIKNAMQTIVCNKLKISKKEIMYMYYDQLHDNKKDECNNGDESTMNIYSYLALKMQYRTKEDGSEDNSIDLFTCRGKYICVDFKELYEKIRLDYTNQNGEIKEEIKNKLYASLFNGIYDYRKRNNLFLFFLSGDMTNHHINTFLKELTRYKLKYMFYNFSIIRGSTKLPIVEYNSNNKVDIKMTINQWSGINEKIGTDASTLKANFDSPPIPIGSGGNILDKAFYTRFLNIRYSPEVEKLVDEANGIKKSLKLNAVIDVLGLQNVKKNYTPKIDAMMNFINLHQDGKHVVFTLFDDYYKSKDVHGDISTYRDYSDYGIKLLKECFKYMDKMTEKDPSKKIDYMVLDSQINNRDKKNDLIKSFNKLEKGVLLTSLTDKTPYDKLKNIKYFHVLDIGVDIAYDIYLNVLFKSQNNPELEVRLWTVTNPDESYSLDQFFKDQFYIFVKKCNEDYLARINKTVNINLENLIIS